MRTEANVSKTEAGVKLENCLKHCEVKVDSCCISLFSIISSHHSNLIP